MYKKLLRIDLFQVKANIERAQKKQVDKYAASRKKGMKTFKFKEGDTVLKKNTNKVISWTLAEKALGLITKYM